MRHYACAPSAHSKRRARKSFSHCNWFFIILQIIRCDTVACGILLLNFVALIRTCKISEFPCKENGLCLPLDKYCDGIDHCGDLSDEPKFCTGEYTSSSWWTIINKTASKRKVLSIFLMLFLSQKFATVRITVTLDEHILYKCQHRNGTEFPSSAI